MLRPGILALPEIDTRYGRLAVLDPENDHVSRFLAEYGEWAELEVRFVADLIREGAAIADVGAAIGTFGLGLQHERAVGRICFVEDDPERASLLKQNVERNCRIPCTVVETGIVPLISPGQGLTLGELDRRYGPFDLIKLDAKGRELAVLAGESGLLERTNSTLWLRCKENESSLDLAEYLLARGRKLYYFAFPSFTPDNLRGKRTPVFPFGYRGHLLAAALDPERIFAAAGEECIARRIASRDDLRVALWRTPRRVPLEWWNLSNQELIAMATRQANKEEFDNFLVPGTAPPKPSDEDDAQAHALKILAKFRSHMIAREEQFRRVQHKHRNVQLQAQAVADHHLVLLRTERELRIEAEAALTAVLTSTTWRATNRLRTLLANTPRLRQAARAMAHALARLFPRGS